MALVSFLLVAELCELLVETLGLVANFSWFTTGATDGDEIQFCKGTHTLERSGRNGRTQRTEIKYSYRY
jgi:hypothetical protein